MLGEVLDTVSSSNRIDSIIIVSQDELAFHIGKKFNRNPYNNNHIAGTSSTGSAISVSVDALPITIGTQTAGSIIRPASFCGVYGFKPTYGAIDRTGILKTNDLFDTVGLLSKEIKLISLLFKTLFLNPTLSNFWQDWFNSFEIFIFFLS